MTETDSTSQAELQSVMQEGLAAFAAAEWSRAEVLFRRCLALSPGHPGILHNLGAAAHRQNAPAEAEALLVEATRAGAGIETWLLLGSLYEADGRTPQAFTCFKHALKLNPGNFQAAVALAGIKERMGDPSGARECYRIAHEAEPADVETARKYAGMVWAKDPERAVGINLGVLGRVRDNPGARARVLEILICQVEWWERIRRGQMPYHAARLDELFFHYALPYLEEMEATNAAIVATGATTERATIRLGLARFCRGDRHGAEALFQSAPASIADNIFGAVRFSPVFYDQLRRMTDADLTAALPPCLNLTPLVPDAAGVLYLACDPVYFTAFALPMLCSLAENSPNTPVHLHVMDAAPEQIAHILNFCRRLAPLRFALSTERPGLQGAPAPEARCYYHAIRFIRFYEHLKLYQCPLWLTDVDALVNRDLGELFALLHDHDAAMRIRPGRLEPWNQFNACVLGASQSGRSRDYHRQVAAYAAHFHQRNALRWGIDQLAMYGVFADLQDRGAAPSLALLGEREVDYDYRDDGFIWCNSGGQKFHHLRRVTAPGKLPTAEVAGNRFLVAFERYWRTAQEIATTAGWTI